MKITLCDICKEEVKNSESHSHILIRNVVINKLYYDFEDICESCEKEIIKLILQIKDRPKAVK
jgi:hypothetical protein